MYLCISLRQHKNIRLSLFAGQQDFI
jgi:hypothetical protein